MQGPAKRPLKLVLRNVTWLLIERGIQIGLALIISALIARSFGPELYGKWQYAITLLFVFNTLTYLCGTEVIVPRLVQTPDQSGSILGTAFLIRITASISAFFLGFTLTDLLLQDHEVILLTRILLILIFISEPFGVITAWFQSRTYIGPVVKIRLAALIIKCATIFIIFAFSADHKFVAMSWVAEGALIACALFIIYQTSSGPKWQFSTSHAKVFLREGSAYFLGLILMTGFLRADRFFLAELTNFSQLGIYSAAIQVSENWFIFASILSQSIAPRYIYADNNRSAIDSNIKKILYVYLAISFAGSALIATSANIIIQAIFGPIFAEATNLLRASAFISIPVFVDSIFNSLMLRERAAKWVILKWATALACAVIANLALIETLGVLAPLLGLSLGYVVACMIGLLYWAKWRRLHLRRTPAL